VSQYQTLLALKRKRIDLKNKKSTHGGKRPGAGRKKKPRALPVPLSVTANGQSAEDLAKMYVGLAIETLAAVASGGASESARVAAANQILNRAAGMPKPGMAAKSDQLELADDWGDLLKSKQPAAGRTN
jgi:hypothetical protein